MLFEIRAPLPWERSEPRASAKGGIVTRIEGDPQQNQSSWPAKIVIDGVGDVEFRYSGETPLAAGKRWRVLTAASSVGMLKAALIQTNSGPKVSFMVDSSSASLDRLMSRTK